MATSTTIACPAWCSPEHCTAHSLAPHAEHRSAPRYIRLDDGGAIAVSRVGYAGRARVEVAWWDPTQDLSDEPVEQVEIPAESLTAVVDELAAARDDLLA